MAGDTGYKNKWQAENRERINMVVPKGYKEIVKAAADTTGESVNGYIKKAIDERMERDGFATAAPEPESTREQNPLPETAPQREPLLLPPDAEEKVDLKRLLTDISYQFTVRDAFGEDGLSRLLDKARQAE